MMMPMKMVRIMLFAMYVDVPVCMASGRSPKWGDDAKSRRMYDGPNKTKNMARWANQSRKCNTNGRDMLKALTMQKYVHFDAGPPAARWRARVNARVRYVGVMDQEIRCGHFAGMSFHRNPSSGRVVVYFLHDSVIICSRKMGMDGKWYICWCQLHWWVRGNFRRKKSKYQKENQSIWKRHMESGYTEDRGRHSLAFGKLSSFFKFINEKKRLKFSHNKMPLYCRLLAY